MNKNADYRKKNERILLDAGKSTNKNSFESTKDDCSEPIVKRFKTDSRLFQKSLTSKNPPLSDTNLNDNVPSKQPAATTTTSTTTSATAFEGDHTYNIRSSVSNNNGRFHSEIGNNDPDRVEAQIVRIFNILDSRPNYTVPPGWVQFNNPRFSFPMYCHKNSFMCTFYKPYYVQSEEHGLRYIIRDSFMPANTPNGRSNRNPMCNNDNYNKTERNEQPTQTSVKDNSSSSNANEDSNIGERDYRNQQDDYRYRRDSVIKINKSSKG